MSLTTSGFVFGSMPRAPTDVAFPRAKAVFEFIRVAALTLGVAAGLMCITGGLYLYVWLLVSGYK